MTENGGKTMKKYIGTKIIKACRANESDCHPMKEGQEDREGYKVIYDNKYESWSPKEVFEIAYREITTDELGMIVEDEIVKTETGVE